MKEGINITYSSGSKTLILFIHGFTGASLETWTNKDFYFPKMLEELPLIQDRYDIGVFEYYSRLSDTKVFIGNVTRLFKKGLHKKNKNNSIMQIKDLLKTQMRINGQYDNIIYISHSMGGLIAKAAIIEELEKDSMPKTKLFISLAVPHNGSNIANIGKLISSNLQVENLSSFSDLTHDLNVSWNKIENKPITKYLYATNDQVVPKNSASSIDNKNEIIAINADHVTICKPADDNDEVFKLVDIFINEVTEKKANNNAKGELVFIPSDYSDIKISNDIDSKVILDNFIRPDNPEIVSLEFEVINTLSSEQQGNIYEIYGEPGAGKSIVAQALIKYINSNFERSNIIFVDLMSFEKEVANNNKDVDTCIAELDNSIIPSLKFKNRLLIVDGIDILNPLSNKFKKLIVQYLNNNTFVFFKRDYKGIQSMHSNIDDKSIITARFKCGLHNINNTSKHIHINEMLENILNVDSNNLINAKTRMTDWFFENRYNIRLLNILLDPSVVDSGVNNSAQYFSRFFRTYLKNNNLDAETTKNVTNQSQKFSYNILVNGKFSSITTHDDFFVKRISTQSFEMLGYLSAKYICSEILRLGVENIGEKQIEDVKKIDNVYPYLINKYAKEIINESQENQRKYFHSIKFLYEYSSSRLQAFLCYLLGRFTSQRIRLECIGFLNEKKRLIDNDLHLLHSTNNDVEYLVLHRTIYISLIYLDQRTDDKYIKTILRNHHLDAINRGFHRHYYGDGDYIHDRDMISDDSDHGPFINTFRQMSDKIKGKLSRPDGTINLSVYTLLSLSMSRKQIGLLHETTDVREVLSLINYSLKEVNLHKVVRSYAEVVKYYLDKKYPPLTESLLNIYKLKKTKRSGWNYKKDPIFRSVKFAESVSEHTDFCVRIAQMYLPEKQQVESLISSKELDSTYQDYSKYRILSILSNHDLGEYLYGDVIRMEQTSIDKEKECFALKRLSMTTSCHSSKLLADPFSSIYQPWVEYNYPSEKNINYRVAKDIDNIECLIQLLIYNRDHLNEVSDFNDFKKNLSNRVHTVIGQEIINVIITPLMSESLETHHS